MAEERGERVPASQKNRWCPLAAPNHQGKARFKCSCYILPLHRRRPSRRGGVLADIMAFSPAVPTVLEAKREEFVGEALIHAKSLCEELKISFQLPRRIRRKHTFGDGSKDVQLSYEDYLRRVTFSSIDGVTAEIPERFQQLQNLTQKYAFLRPEVILSISELNLDQFLKTLIKKNSNLSAYVYKLS
ncbi:uncharacterized protein TNCV_738511 [Trichonephila clavipes]|nr:uncharacterized protein TNCV_738511 [Trichonephila clavipes]